MNENIRYLTKPAKLNWRNAAYQDPSDGEEILVIDPKDNSVQQAVFVNECFIIASEKVGFNIEWWLRFDDIPKPD